MRDTTTQPSSTSDWTKPAFHRLVDRLQLYHQHAADSINEGRGLPFITKGRVRSGLEVLDRALLGLEPGKLYAFVGFDAPCPYFLAHTLFYQHAIRESDPTWLCSTEYERDDWLFRLWCRHFDRCPASLRGPQATEDRDIEELERIQKAIQQSRSVIHYTQDWDGVQLSKQIEQSAHDCQQTPTLILIHLNDCVFNSSAEWRQFTASVRATAVATGAPVILLCRALANVKRGEARTAFRRSPICSPLMKGADYVYLMEAFQNFDSSLEDIDPIYLLEPFKARHLDAVPLRLSLDINLGRFTTHGPPIRSQKVVSVSRLKPERVRTIIEEVIAKHGEHQRVIGAPPEEHFSSMNEAYVAQINLRYLDFPNHAYSEITTRVFPNNREQQFDIQMAAAIDAEIADRLDKAGEQSGFTGDGVPF